MRLRQRDKGLLTADIASAVSEITVSVYDYIRFVSIQILPLLVTDSNIFDKLLNMFKPWSLLVYNEPKNHITT